MPRRNARGLGHDLRAVVHEIGRALRSMIRIKRIKSRGQVVVTFTRPRLRWKAQTRKQRVDPTAFISRVTTATLLTLGVGGIMYTLGPVVFMRPAVAAVSPASLVAQPQAITEPEKPKGLSRSVPTKLEIPDIGITTELIKLGKNEDGTMATPERYDIAGWYEFAPTPGEIGPAIIVGHVDNYLGAAIFYELKNMQPGQIVKVTREDRRIVDFRVDKVELFDQQNFPTEAVYGNIDHAGLRLITCGGSYNPLTGRYTHNTVVYATKV